MSKWDKLIKRICNLSKDIRFNELRKVLGNYGYEMKAPGRGGSHFTFRNTAALLLQYLKMNLLKGFMQSWSGIL